MSTRIVSFCADLITRSGPLPLDHLVAHVRDNGVSKARNPEAPVRTALARADGIVELPDGRFDAARRMLDGAVLTHRVRAATTGRRVLFAGPELTLFDELLSAGPVPLASGGEVSRSTGDIDGLVGPPGWLPDVGADTLLALRHTAGTLSIAPVQADPTTLTERADRLRAALAHHGTTPNTAGERRRAASSWSGQWSSSDPEDWPDFGAAGTSWQRGLIRAVLRALHEFPDLLAEPMPPLDEVLAFPPVAWSQAWSRPRSHDLYGGRPPKAIRFVLPAVPESLHQALSRVAGAAGIPVEELAMLHLAAATYRWEAPCRHDAEQAWLDRFAREERARAKYAYEDAHIDLDACDELYELYGDPNAGHDSGGGHLGVVR